MLRVDAFAAAHLPQLAQLVNLHLAAAIPGWALSEAALARHLERDDAQPVTDPWVAERSTLCALEGGPFPSGGYRVLAAAHLVRYGTAPEVGAACRGTAEIGWFLTRPDRPDAAAALLAATDEEFLRWGIANPRGWGAGLPAGPLWGVPDVWPHVADALRAAGYRPDPTAHREALYGGWLSPIQPPANSPVPGLAIRRRITTYETRLAAIGEDLEIGHCDVQPDLTRGGLSPVLGGWAWLTDLQVREDWRGRGIGTWLVQHAIAWLRLAGCDRVVLAVDDADDAVHRFYRRFGWGVLTRETHGWTREASRIRAAQPPGDA